MNQFLTILAFLLLLLPQKGQGQSLGSTISSNVLQQLQSFPQEKIYLFTDKPAYVAGEHIWFRAFLTDATLHYPDISPSRYVYIDLIDPDGTILKHHMIRPDSSGVFHNRIELDYDMAEGAYTLRAYTAYMQAKPEYLFQKSIFIADPQSSAVAIEPQFTMTSDRQITVSFSFRDLKDSSLLSVETVKVKVGEADFQEFPTRRPISFRVNPEKEKHLCVAFTYTARQYKKYITIPFLSDTLFDVSFFPEGGYLLDNIPTKIGFKALGGNGMSQEITGDVYDSDNRHITSINTLHAGMGFFMITPEAGKRYYALCSNKDRDTLRFELPEVAPDACVLRVASSDEQFIISAHGKRLTQDADLFLIIHLRGMVFYADKIPPNNRVTFQTAQLPPGIIQVLLLDKEMNPLSERLIFNKLHDFAKVEIMPHKSEYGKRELVKVGIRLDLPSVAEEEGNTGEKLSGSFAVSVTDDHDILPDSTFTIASYLLLSSELKGHIEDANFYLSSDSAATEALDALMLTQGWRRYDIPAAAKGAIEIPDSYMEMGQEIAGTVKLAGLPGGPVQNASVLFTVPDMNSSWETKTDKSGLFHFSGFEFPDSTLYIVNAFASRNRRLMLVMDPEQPLLPATPFPAQQQYKDDRFDLVAKAEQRYTEEYGIRRYDIPEAVITAQRREERSIYSFPTTNRTIQQEYIEVYKYNIDEILKYESKVFVTNDYANEGGGQVYLRDAGRLLPEPAVIVIDDISLTQGRLGNGFNINDLKGLPIKRVEIILPPESSIFGFNGMIGGALLITTDKEQTASSPMLHMAMVKPLGYKKAAEFYAPKYENDTQRNNQKPDLRTTIYWHPNVEITDGEATIEFYTADANNTSYSIVFEGITAKGTIIRQTGKIDRNRE